MGLESEPFIRFLIQDNASELSGKVFTASTYDSLKNLTQGLRVWVAINQYSISFSATDEFNKKRHRKLFQVSEEKGGKMTI